MDTTFFYKADEDVMEGINGYLEGDSNELKVIIDYVEYTRYVHEIHQWYEIYNFCLCNLKEVTDKHRGSIEINAYLVNLLASGKNIAENMENYLKFIFGEESADFINFRTYYSTFEYDHNFSYKFLVKLRNFSQHGHIPVSVVGDNARFDVKQIYYTQHYNFNASLKNEVDNFIQFIEKHNPEEADGPHIDFRYTVSSYTVSLYRIYNRFLNIMSVAIHNAKREFFSFVNENEDLINHKKAEYNNLLFYIVSDLNPEHLQVVNMENDDGKMLTDYKNQVIQAIKNEKNILMEMNKHCILIE